MKRFLGLSSLLIFIGYSCCCGFLLSYPQRAFAEVSSEKAVTKYYFVKGMFCAGCAFGVKKALERAGVSKNEIKDVSYKEPDPDNRIGHVVIEFQPGKYQGEKTDCKIIKEIRKSPGYTAYLDPAITDPCKLGS